MLRCALASILCCASVAAVDHYLSLTVEGMLMPTSYDITSTYTDPNTGTVIGSGSASSHITRSYRWGFAAIGRLTPSYWISPAVGVAWGRTVQQDVEIDQSGETQTVVNTLDGLAGVSFRCDRHVFIDVLPFVGGGRGHSTLEKTTSASFETWYPDVKQREYGLRTAVTFISDKGWTLSLFGGLQRSTVDYEGLHTVDNGLISTAYQQTATQKMYGGFVGVGWGYSL